MTTSYSGKRRHTRKGPPLRNQTQQTRKDEEVTVFNPDGSIAAHFFNERSGYELRVTNVGSLIQGDGVSPYPWSYEVRQNGFPKGQVDWSDSGVLKSRSEGTYDSTPLSSPNWDWQEVDNKTIDRFYDIVRGGLDLSVDIAEAGQARKMIGSSFKLVNFVRSIPDLGPLIRRASNSLRNGRLGRDSARDIGKGISDKWLEYQYGWKPLISSIYGAADESQRLVLNKIQNFSVRARVPMSDPVDQNIRDLRFRARDRYNVVGVQSAECSIRMSVPSWDLARWTSLNPVSIAWELMPYSFVVDWMYDVGGTLRRLESALLYDKHFQSGYWSRLFYYYTSYQKEGLLERATGASGTYFGRISAWKRDVQFNRVLLSGMPGGHLPTIKADLGSSQLLNAAALLAQFLKPGGKTFR